MPPTVPAARRSHALYPRLTLLAAVVLLSGLAVAQVPPALGPQEAVKNMKVADGLEMRVVASEADVRKPVTLTFDDRGRMWIIQYLQYPTPNGLKPVKVDQ